MNLTEFLCIFTFSMVMTTFIIYIGFPLFALLSSGSFWLLFEGFRPLYEEFKLHIEGEKAFIGYMMADNQGEGQNTTGLPNTQGQGDTNEQGGNVGLTPDEVNGQLKIFLAGFEENNKKLEPVKEEARKVKFILPVDNTDHENHPFWKLLKYQYNTLNVFNLTQHNIFKF